MADLVSALYCFDKATASLQTEEGNSFINSNTLEEAIDYINIKVINAADQGKFMIMPLLSVRSPHEQKDLFRLLREAGYKVYPGLAGELYAISWEVGTSWERFYGDNGERLNVQT